MRAPRARFTVRWLMIAVAIVAILLGGAIEVHRLRRLASDYRARAARHAATQRRLMDFFREQDLCRDFWSSLAADRRKRAAAARSLGVPDGPANAVETWAELAVQAKDQAAWHARAIAHEAPKLEYSDRMRWKWERAARYPWLPVAPDPPPPE